VLYVVVVGHACWLAYLAAQQQHLATQLLCNARRDTATTLSCLVLLFNVSFVLLSLSSWVSRTQKFGMTDIASFGVSFESNDLHLPAVTAAPSKDATAGSSKAAKKSKKGKKGAAAAVEEEAVEPLASSKSGHVLKNLLPAGGNAAVLKLVK
jgi:hypothetical protein